MESLKVRICQFCILLLLACNSTTSKHAGNVQALEFESAEDMLHFLPHLEDYLQKMAELVQRNRTLALGIVGGKSAKTNLERVAADIEFKQLLIEIVKMREEARYKKVALLNEDDITWPQKIRIRADRQLNAEFPLPVLKPSSFGMKKWTSDIEDIQVNLRTYVNANKAVSQMDESLQAIARERAYLGDLYNKLEHRVKLEYSLSQTTR